MKKKTLQLRVTKHKLWECQTGTIAAQSLCFAVLFTMESVTLCKHVSIHVTEPKEKEERGTGEWVLRKDR